MLAKTFKDKMSNQSHAFVCRVIMTHIVTAPVQTDRSEEL